jgi:hypothetical protein
MQPWGYVLASPAVRAAGCCLPPTGGPLYLTGIRKVMPIFTYFATTGPVLLALLLALNAYFEPEKAPSRTELLAIGTANAHSGPSAQVVGADEASHFLRLKQIPINAIKGPF